MVFLNAITLTQPTGLWQTILYWLEGLVHNYAVAIILFAIGLKLVMSPFDILNKYSTKKNSRINLKMKPELDKINQKYAGQKDIINQKTMELYKKYNFNVSGMCFTTIVPMLLSTIIFASVFGAMGTISRYKSSDQILQVREAYFSAYDIDVNTLEDTDNALVMLNTYLEDKTDEEKAELLATAQERSAKRYEETKDSFLWIENIWLPDTAWTNSVMDYKKFLENSGVNGEVLSEEEFNLVLSSTKENTRECNGFFILVILSMATSYLSTAINGWVTKLNAKKKGISMDKVGLGQGGKVMLLILPAIIGIINLFYYSAFALYLTVGSMVLLITNPIITIFIDMLEFEAIEKEEDKTMAIYDRKRK